VARIRAVERRSGAFRPRVVVLDDIEIDLESHEVKRKGATIHLTAKEFKLVHYLVEHAGAVVPHRRLLQAVWGPDYGDEVEYLRVFVNQVRKKIEPDPRNPRYLLTEPSIGYRLVSGAAASGKS
jgi:two-component system, OmpR family, KDP operon response regulator KdpE